MLRGRRRFPKTIQCVNESLTYKTLRKAKPQVRLNPRWELRFALPRVRGHEVFELRRVLR